MTRRRFTSEFKTNVALEALKGRPTITELAEKFNLNIEEGVFE